MPTRACEIDRRIVNEAEKMAEEGYDGTYTFKDYGKLGLHLRVRGHRAVWLSKFKQSTKTIGQLYPCPTVRPITSVKAAREKAANVRTILMSQPDKFEAYMAHRDQGLDHEASVARLVKTPPGWTLRACFEATLEDKLSKDGKKSVAPATERDIRYVLSRPTWANTLDCEATRLTQGDLEKVRDATRKSHGVSASVKLVSYTREALTWCARFHSGASGLEKVHPWWLMLASPVIVKPKTRRPELDEAVRTLWIAEQFLSHPLPGRQCFKSGVHPWTLAALWWAVLTCQRTGAAFSLMKSDLVTDPLAPEDWQLASWNVEKVKGNQRVILPVPKQAIDHLNRFLRMQSVYGETEFFLPSTQNSNKTVTGSGAYQILSRLAGKDRNKPENDRRLTPKSNPWPDLLGEEGIDWWSPHDIRRTLAKFLSDAGYAGGASAILTHAIKDPTILGFNQNDQSAYDRMRQSAADVTERSYGAHSPYMDLKKDSIKLWVKAVLDAYEEQKSIPWRSKEMRNL
ncbi:hypothetical protein [Tateyamaria sp. Alg231-49]|uniref:hypothetical protein n=1 Tax=Tateyamaria sp. Alg231-49 TaxID=1922219 RepID=UPI000D55B053|nr:hypothetical protein [Tateyamaria sp. Alg231-49]